jgi:hypothetical protein
MFRLVPNNGHDMNKGAAQINFQLAKSTRSKLFVKSAAWFVCSVEPALWKVTNIMYVFMIHLKALTVAQTIELGIISWFVI